MNLSQLYGVKNKKVNPSKKDYQKEAARRERLKKASLVLVGYDWLRPDKEQIVRMLEQSGMKRFECEVDADWIMRNIQSIIDLYYFEKGTTVRCITDPWFVSMDQKF